MANMSEVNERIKRRFPNLDIGVKAGGLRKDQITLTGSDGRMVMEHVRGDPREDSTDEIVEECIYIIEEEFPE